MQEIQVLVQHLDKGSQAAVTPVPGDLTSSSDNHCHPDMHAIHLDICNQNTQTHTVVKFKQYTTPGVISSLNSQHNRERLNTYPNLPTPWSFPDHSCQVYLTLEYTVLNTRTNQMLSHKRKDTLGGTLSNYTDMGEKNKNKKNHPHFSCSVLMDAFPVTVATVLNNIH